MPKRGSKGIERLFKECAEANNGAAFKRVVESTFRCAVSDGFVIDEDTGDLVFDPKQVHPSVDAARSLIFKYVLGLPTQKVEHTVEHQIPFVFDAAMLRAANVQTLEIEEYDEGGETVKRLVVASDPGAETMAEALGDD